MAFISKYILLLYPERSDKCYFPQRFVDSSTGVSLQLQMCLLQFTSDGNAQNLGRRKESLSQSFADIRPAASRAQ